MIYCFQTRRSWIGTPGAYKTIQHPVCVPNRLMERVGMKSYGLNMSTNLNNSHPARTLPYHPLNLSNGLPGERFTTRHTAHFNLASYNHPSLLIHQTDVSNHTNTANIFSTPFQHAVFYPRQISPSQHSSYLGKELSQLTSVYNIFQETFLTLPSYGQM